MSGQLNPNQMKLFEYAPRPTHDPVGFLREAAEGYVAQRGGTYQEPSPDLQNDPRRGYARAMAYERSEENTPEAEQSYAAMREDLAHQWDYLTGPADAGGMGVQVETTDDDPYGDPQEMMNDIAENRRLKVFSSASTPHPYFTPEENERFRAVHDAFGHAAIGSSFSRHGEEKAYQSHAQMFRPEAHGALRNETRGQNSVLNFRLGEFPEQKLATIPADRELKRRGLA